MTNLIGVQITERDRLTLRWVADQYAARVDTLAKVLGRLGGGEDQIADKTVWRVVDRWRRAGLADRHRVIVGDPAWVTTTAEGRRIADATWPSWSMRTSQLEHVRAVGEVRDMIERKRSDLRWVCERELRSTQAQARRRGEHLADGLVVLGNEKRIAIEVELTAKTLKRTADIVDGLTSEPEIDAVWYFVSKRATSPVMKAAIGHPTVLVHDLTGVRINA